MTETPTLDDIDQERTREIGETIKQLSEGDVVRVTNNRLDFYVKGEVVEKVDRLNGEEFYEATIAFGDHRARIHANWRDILEDADDQETPYTGLRIEPFDDTAPAVTDIEVVELEVSITKREVTETKTFVEVGGEEFELARFMDFMEAVEGTDGFISGVRSTGSDRIAEHLQSLDIVDRSQSTGWYVTDDDAHQDLYEEVEEQYIELET